METTTTVTALVRALAAKTISASEATDFYLERIERSDLNAFIDYDAERARGEARQADEEIARSGHHDLLGVPIALKDIFCTDGIRTTCGSRMLENFVPPYDATVTAKFKRAGSVLLGKTNMDEFAMGSSNETSFFGPVGNPWSADHVPGGSSGGSAAAVAGALCAAAIGTDTGGSIRLPAAFCGVSGLKPTYGRVSRYGMIAFASSLDQGGPIARSVEDLRLLLRAMEGFDPNDSTSADVRSTSTQHDGGGALRIGVPEEYWRGLDTGVGQTLDEARRVLETLGHSLVPVSLPHTQAAVPVYYVISSAEASTNLSRYDGVRFGHRAADIDDIESLYRRSRTEGFGTEVKRRILTGTYTLSVGYYDAYYDKAQRVRRLIRQDFLDAFESVDALVAPVSLGAAFERNAFQNPTDMYRQDQFTAPVSLAGLPALSVPCGFTAGLPLGMQLISPHFTEHRLLSLGEAFQRETDWHQQTPANL